MPLSNPVDRQILAALEADTSRELIPELIQVFIKSADNRIAQITAHLAASDLAGIASVSRWLNAAG